MDGEGLPQLEWMGYSFVAKSLAVVVGQRHSLMIGLPEVSAVVEVVKSAVDA